MRENKLEQEQRQNISVDNLTTNKTKEDKDVLENALDFLLRIYKTKINILSGAGTTRENSYANVLLDVINEEPFSRKTLYHDLPTNVQLNILSFLDVRTLCNICKVCRSWNDLANDKLLWEKKLRHDSYVWQRIDHLSHPLLHLQTNPELSSKEIYLKCCPESRQLSKASIQFPTQIPNLSYFFGFSVPRIVMFGSGLDSSGLVKRILWDQRSPFSVKGMFPGQFDGIGSGVTLQHAGGTMNMITLYALPRAERQQQRGGERRSKLLVGEEISQPVKELCNTVDAFIYVVNTSNEERVTFGSEEFRAMIDDRWLQPKVPVLVLCVVPNATIKSVSSLEVANKLNLLSLSRPWQVRQCHINSLYGFMPGVTWLNKHIMGF